MNTPQNLMIAHLLRYYTSLYDQPFSRKCIFMEFWAKFIGSVQKMPGGSRFWSKLPNFDSTRLIILGVNQKMGTRSVPEKKVIWSPPY